MARDENLQGTAALIEKLQELGALEDGKALRASVRAGMTPVKKAAVLKIPVGDRVGYSYKTGETLPPGYARDHIKLATFMSPDKQVAEAVVTTNEAAYYAVSFVERGTGQASGRVAKRQARQKYVTKERGFRGQAAQPWLRPAFYQNQNSLKQAMFDRLNLFIAKVIKKQSAAPQ